MITTFTKRTILIPKDVMSMFDLGFLGVEKDFPEQKSSLHIKKEKDCKLYSKKSTTVIIQGRGS